MRHDSLNMDAPHTLRELAQAEDELPVKSAWVSTSDARTMGEEIGEIHASISWLRGKSAHEEISAVGEAGNPVSGDLISREAAIILVREELFGNGLGAELVMHVEHALWTLPSQLGAGS